ncbi:hypothetical protein [Deinococcus ruber]|uniref:Uncharacterized protein n=1 Tax=Deinococcus ruber TaxID=1848197 RepID=A0A918FJ80_9DEIO|nr:hypothetical protein [Deinococcus ruber]GGR41145.1 hypothetical protein GCM10008957_56600 [Deinococcus ruber]
MSKSAEVPVPTLTMTVRATGLSTTFAELQVVHVPPSGIIAFPNRSGFEVTHLPGSSDVLSASRTFSVNLNVLAQRYGDQAGHLYAVSIHSQPRTLEFRDMDLTVVGSGVPEQVFPLRLADHVALLGVWWQNRSGAWNFEYSGKTLDSLNAPHQAIYLAGRYAERYSDE